MKTQIVQLEPHDDYVSVRDRMEWGQTTRVLLVWPLRGRILNRRLDLTLLKRHSAALGSQLALVTHDRDARYHANKLDIPVYKSIREAEQSRWLQPRRGRKKSKTTTAQISKDPKRVKPDLETLRQLAHPNPSKWLTHPVIRIISFTLGVLSTLIIAAIFIPRAEIYVTPASIVDSSIISVNASPDHKTMEISGAVPTYWQSVIVEGRGSIPTTGKTLIPRQAATGRVTFTNLTEEEIIVPDGTVVSTTDDPPIRFVTLDSVTIPTGPEGVTVRIEALEPGSSGNISAQKIIAIEGPLGLNLTVYNLRATFGGDDYTAAAPTEADYEQVYDELFDSLAETAFEEFQTRQSDDNDMPLSSSAELLQVLEETYTPEIGAPSDQLVLTLRVEFQIPYAAGADLYQLGRAVLDRQIPEDFTPRPETLVITQLIEPESQELGEASWKIEANWKLGANLDEPQAVSLILGLTPEKAAQQLSDQLPINGTPAIHLIPEWWPRLPILPFRVNFVDESTTSAESTNAAFWALSEIEE